MSIGQLLNAAFIPLDGVFHHALAHLFANALAFLVALLERLLFDGHGVVCLESISASGTAHSPGRHARLIRGLAAANDSRGHIRRHRRPR